MLTRADTKSVGFFYVASHSAVSMIAVENIYKDINPKNNLLNI